MLLAIDVGNTNTVLGLFNGDKLEHSWRIKTDASSTADEIALIFKGLLADAPKVTGVSLCSTVPRVLHEMRLVNPRENWLNQKTIAEARPCPAQSPPCQGKGFSRP